MHNLIGSRSRCSVDTRRPLQATFSDLAMSDGPQVDCSRSEGEGLLSPKKLQRSIWNQVAEVPPSISPNPHLNLPSSLSLRSINLAPSLPAVLHQSKHHASHINSLDISYSIVEARTVSALCRAFGNLQSLSAVNCGLEELDSEMPWPKGLKRIDLSRNKLNKFPNGIACLMYLETLNISGNLIRTVDPAVLQLPSLQKLYLLNNPIQDIPRHVCRAGVSEMRRYLHVEPLPLPEEESEQLRSRRKSLSSKNLRKFLREHTWTESTESGYDSPYQRVLSTSSCSSLSDIHHDLDLQWPTFHSDTLPKGYTQVASGSLCQVYLPEECGESVHIEIVKDLSLHPQVHSNELLITPVVRITPHGMMFPMDKPAIVALSHCARPRSQGQEEMVPLCSDTGLYEPPTWTRLESDHRCEVFHDCVTFSTTHFSLFAVVSVLPYPFAKAEINPDEGGILTVPELPGFELYIPPGSIDIPVTLQATVYYANHTESDIDGNLSLATACVGLEPHGMEFTTPVCVSIPVPDFASIKASFQDAQLQLWCSPYINEHTFHWEHVSNTNISVQEGIELNGHVATFQVNHFSFFELLWTICRDTLQRLGYGASFVYNQLPSRTRYVSVRCQVFMSHPLNDLTFGILVAVYKFGDPLTELSNYKWKLADTGNKRMFLRTGELRVSLEGCFEPRGEVGETTLSRRTDIEFSGEDFCLRFEFALRLRDLPLPLADHQLIGKMHIHQWDGTTLMELNLIKPVEGSNTAFSSQTPGPTCTPTMLQQTAQYMEFTPPWSPDSDIIAFADHHISPSPVPHDDPNTSTNTPTRRRKHRYISHGDPPASSCTCLAKRRLMVRDGKIGDKSDRFLMEVAHGIGPKWEEVGVALELDYDTVNSVVGSSDSGKPEHLKAFHMLQEWKRRAAFEFSFTRLAAALEEAGLSSCAQQHCYEQHSDSND